MWYVEADSVLTFIDFGMTSVTYQGVDVGCGVLELEEFGVGAGPWPLHDAYKVMCFIAHSLIKSRSNPTVLEEIRKIFTFFNKTETLEKAIMDQYKLGTYFSLPKLQDIAHFNVMHLITHILDVGNVGDIVTSKPSHPVLECTSCYSFAATLDGVYVRDPVPTNFFDFYETAKHLGATSKISYDRMVNSFDYQSAAIQFKKQVEDAMIEMKKYLINEHLPNIPRQPTVRDLANKTTYKESQDAYVHLVSAISHYEDIRIWLSVGNAVAILFQDRDIINFINKKRQELADVRKMIVARINEIREFYRKIASFVGSPEWDKYNDLYPFYLVNSGEIISLRDRFSDADQHLFVEQRLPSTIIKTEPLVRQKANVQQPAPQTMIVPNRVGVLPQKRRVAVIRNVDGIPIGLNAGM
jgi:hypothetical protein